MGELSNNTQTCTLGKGCDQVFHHPAAASNVFEMTSASIDCAFLFSCRLCIAALTPARILLCIFAYCVADAHTASSSMPNIDEQLQGISCTPGFMTLNIMSCLQWVMQLMTGGSEEQLGEMAAQAEQHVDSLIAMYAQVHSFLFY